MVIGFGNSTVSRLRTILEDLNLTLNMAKSGALVNSSSWLLFPIYIRGFYSPSSVCVIFIGITQYEVSVKLPAAAVQNSKHEEHTRTLSGWHVGVVPFEPDVI